MTERRTLTLGERWRRLSAVGVDHADLEQALASLPSIRSPRLRVVPGSIVAEMEGAMGSINEVSINVPRVPAKIWPQVVRVLRRSASMQHALREGQVPRSFDRLIARIAGEPLLPEPRRVAAACSCGAPEFPCRHILALHELFARRLDEHAWELLVLRGVDLRQLLKEAASVRAEDLPPLAFGAAEEPVLFPDSDGGGLDSTLTAAQTRSLLGAGQVSFAPAVAEAIARYASG